MTTAVNFSVFYLLYSILHMESNTANIISVIFAVIFAYVTNKIFVFKSKTSNVKALFYEALLFFGARSITLFLEVAGVFVATTIFMADPGYSKIAINVIVLILNYIFSSAIFTNKIKLSSLNKRFILFFICYLLFFTLCFIPILSCWYYGDDMYSRNIRELMQYYKLSFLQYNINYFKYIIGGVGRFLPIHLINRNVVFYVFHNIIAYRFYIYISNLIAIFLFAQMVWEFSKSRKLFYSILIMYPAVFFFLTSYDDPITSYFMFLQTLTIYFSLALIFTKYYIETNKRCYIISALILYVLALLTYEISYPMGILFLFVFYFYKEGTTRERIIYALKKIIPFAVLLIINFSIYVYFSKGASIYYGGSETNLNPLLVFKTFTKQIFAGLPVFPSIYALYNSLFDINIFLNNINKKDVLTVIVFIVIIIVVFKQKNMCLDDESDKKTTDIFLIALSLVLIICPSLVIGVTTKYQKDLKVGLGYLPTYLTRFGILIIGYLIYDLLIKLLKKLPKSSICINAVNVVVIACFSFTLLFSLQVNRKVLAQKNFYIPSRLFIEKALNQDLFETFPDNSNVLVDTTWIDQDSDPNLSALFSAFSKKRIEIFTYKNNNEEKALTKLSEKKLFYFDHKMFNLNEGYVIVGEIISVGENDRPNKLKNVKIYYFGDKYDALNIVDKKAISLIKKTDFYTAFISDNIILKETLTLIDTNESSEAILIF